MAGKKEFYSLEKYLELTLEANKRKYTRGTLTISKFLRGLLAGVTPAHIYNWGTRNGSDGGWAIPTLTADRIFAVDPGQAIVRPRATVLEPPGGVLPAGDHALNPDAPVTVPYLDQTNDLYGGLLLEVQHDNAARLDLDIALAAAELDPVEVLGTLTITERLLNNSAADKWLEMIFKLAKAGKEDELFLTGNAAIGEPLGIVNAPCRIQVPRAVPGQVAYTDVVNLLSAFLPSSLNRANGFKQRGKPYSVCWVADSTMLPGLLTMVDPGGNKIFRLGEGPNGENTLEGLPLMFCDQISTLALCDFQYYLIKSGFGPELKISNQGSLADFAGNRYVVRLYFAVDGQPALQRPVTLRNGNQASPFVVLE